MSADRGRHGAVRAAWVHEIKHDGFRFICRREGDRVRVFSHRRHDTDGIRFEIEGSRLRFRREWPNEITNATSQVYGR